MSDDNDNQDDRSVELSRLDQSALDALSDSIHKLNEGLNDHLLKINTGAIGLVAVLIGAGAFNATGLIVGALVAFTISMTLGLLSHWYPGYRLYSKIVEGHMRVDELPWINKLINASNFIEVILSIAGVVLTCFYLTLTDFST